MNVISAQWRGLSFDQGSKTDVEGECIVAEQPLAPVGCVCKMQR
jgi:uncharacterized protein affecting Mg2+/Co2+ transport